MLMPTQMLSQYVDERAYLGRAIFALAVQDMDRPGRFFILGENHLQMPRSQFIGHLIGEQPGDAQACAGGCVGLGDAGKDVAGVFQVTATSFSQADAAGGAQQQFDAQLLFEGGDGSGDGSRGYERELFRSGELIRLIIWEHLHGSFAICHLPGRLLIACLSS